MLTVVERDADPCDAGSCKRVALTVGNADCCNHVMQDHRPGSVCQACHEARRQAKAAKAAANSPLQVARLSPSSPSTACALVEDTAEYGADHSAGEKKSGLVPGE